MKFIKSFLILSLMTLSSILMAGDIKVYQSKTCGCCHKWVEHLKANGLKVTSQLMDDVTPVKMKLGIPDHLTSCHTAVVDGYLIEGHVPAVAIKKLLSEKPKVVGLSVPGMPMGSPGMEGPYKDAYNVVAWKRAGKDYVFMKF